MKTIGIKLADGSFYPVLEEGSAAEKSLDLTTAHNNQTKVMVDLYRSATCKMDDAEYVDSLQIENLVAHPNGEADISFIVSIDDDNKLSAKIVDTETGNQSKTTISLVSRTLEERMNTDEYDISDSSDNSDVAAAAVATGGLLAAAAALRDKPIEEDFAAEPVVDDSAAEEPAIEETSVEEPAADTMEDSFASETISDDFDTSLDLPDFGDTTAEETTVTKDFSLGDDTAATEDFSLGDDTESTDDFALGDDSESTDDFSLDETADASDTISDDFDTSLDLPDFEDTTAEETTVTEDFSLGDDTAATEDFSLDETADATDTILDDLDTSLDLPDFEDTIADDTTTDDILADDTTIDDELNTLDLPDFGEDDTEMKDDDFDFDSFDDNTNTSNAGLSFTGLYDKETELGQSAGTFEEEEEIKKKTKVPVIICIICAIICLLATILILFIIPSKYNLFNKGNYEEPVEITAPAEPVVEEPVEEPEPEPVVPAAKEDEIVIIEKAEEVIPEQPPVAEEKPKNVVHKIKWGDTLWDIADTYYKNPWRYKYIARYNGIKNPDHIVSGTTIIIPAE